MTSPKRTDEDSETKPEEAFKDGGGDAGNDIKIKDEPADTGYEKPQSSPRDSDNSEANSRTSSPCPPVHFGSPAQGSDSASQSASSRPQTPLNDSYSGSSIRSQLQGGSNLGKKTDTVQNIVEGLLKKNATLLAMSDTESLRPGNRRANKDMSNGNKDQDYAGNFPISSSNRVKMVPSQGKPMQMETLRSLKTRLLRPKSPTRKCDSLLLDKSKMSYSLMESEVGDETIEKLFKVQHHEFVCAISSRPYIYDKAINEKRVIASLDNNHFWCNFCSFSSSNKSLVTNHILEHRFSCRYCSYESFCRSDVLRHSSKMHEEFSELSDNVRYCTFLSDYIRNKSRCEGIPTNGATDPDEDIGEVDHDTMTSVHAADLKRKREMEESLESSQNSKWAKMDSPDTATANGQKTDKPGKSRKSQNPRRLPQVNEKDYDTFEMEVEEIDEAENNSEDCSDKVPNKSFQKTPVAAAAPHMQLIPSLQDEDTHSFTTTHVSRPTPPTPVRHGRPSTYAANNNRATSRNNRSASSSSLYWSCGYCDFQSSSQAEIKEHSNRTHPGKPHRLILNKGNAKNTPVGGKSSTAAAGKTSAPAGGKISTPAGGGKACTPDMPVRNDAEENLQAATATRKSQRKKKVSSRINWNDNYLSPDHASIEDKTVEVSHDPSKSEIPASHDTCSGHTEVGGSQVDEMISKPDAAKDSLDTEETSFDQKETLSPPNSSLKLTFRTVGSKTVCSMNSEAQNSPSVKDESMSCDDSLNTEMESMESSKSHSNLDDLTNSSLESSKGNCSYVSDKASSPLQISDRHATCSQATAGAETQREFERMKTCDSIGDKEVPHFDFVPARSAAVKAMTKMKPLVDDEEKEDNPKDSKCKDVRKSDRKMKPHSSLAVSKLNIYTCSYCSNYVASPLRTVKSHLANVHPDSLPILINVKKRKSKMKSIFYICPFSSCKQMFIAYTDFITHKSSHVSLISASRKSNEETSPQPCDNSTAGTNVCLSVQGSLKKKNIPQCRVLLHPLKKSKLESLVTTTDEQSVGQSSNPTTPDPIATEEPKVEPPDKSHLDESETMQSRPESREEGRFDCLYCTDRFSSTSLSDIKQHYSEEHPDQLLVVRDLEAKKEKLASRFYVCDEKDCTFSSTSRADLDSHSKQHRSNTNCTHVYECAGCGWYSSSFWSAKDHLNEHSPDENVSLVQMQLSVDEYGQTTKKVLKTV